MSLNFKLSNLPSNPGVYLFKNSLSKIIYIGKAKNIKKRVLSYFQKNTKDLKTQLLKQKIQYIDYIITNNENEALILEKNLIQKKKPIYNIELKDDKEYPFIKISIKDIYPRIYKTRKIINDGSLYFGPYPHSRNVYYLFEIIKKIFKIRSCKLKIPNQNIPCILYHKNCDKKKFEKISLKNYKQYIHLIINILKGKYKIAIYKLSEQMNLFSKNLQFEESIKIRNQIEQLKKIEQKQEIVFFKKVDMDIIGLFINKNIAHVNIFFIRDGKLIFKSLFQIRIVNPFEKNEKKSNSTIVLEEIIRKFYSNKHKIPQKIIIPIKIDSLNIIQKYLFDIKGKKTELIFPLKGKKYNLLQLANKNAQLNNFIHMKEIKEKNDILLSLKKKLNLNCIPNYIEGFDISNTLGDSIVGSSIVFINGYPKKKEYRIFHIQTIKNKPNDYQSIFEVIFRRYNKKKYVKKHYQI